MPTGGLTATTIDSATLSGLEALRCISARRGSSCHEITIPGPIIDLNEGGKHCYDVLENAIFEYCSDVRHEDENHGQLDFKRTYIPLIPLTEYDAQGTGQTRL
jgi:hypothetical protein